MIERIERIVEDHHRGAARPQDAMDLAQRGVDLALGREVIERRRRHHQVERAVAQPEPAQVADEDGEAARGEAPPRAPCRA